VTAVSTVAASAPDQDEEITAALWASITPGFLALVRWDPEARILRFPQHHGLLGWNVCAVVECSTPTETADRICIACAQRRRAVGNPPLDEFTTITRPRRPCTLEVGFCSVAGCERSWKPSTASLCVTHEYQRREIFLLSLEDFLSHPDAVPLPAFGQCEVAACSRQRIGHGPYCHTHKERWRKHLRKYDELDESQWRRTQSGPVITGQVNLRALPARVVAEVIYGVQQSIKDGIKSPASHVRPYCDHLRMTQAESIHDFETQKRGTQRIVHNRLAKYARRHGLSPETERHKDEWDSVVFGHAGTLRFSGISRSWLREAVKSWASEDLPKRRGNGATYAVQKHVRALAELSDSLRLQRDDRGEYPASLSRTDVTNFLNRLAYLQTCGEISAYQRLTWCRSTRNMLTRMRGMGLTRPGRSLHGLSEDFALADADIPDEPEDAEAGKDLPVEVMRHLCDHLPLLEEQSCTEIRVATELVIDTGRRPDEICQLKLDCLERDGDRKPVLVYDNIKAHRQDRRLPIPAATAVLITRQQQRVRDRFPDEPVGQLKLLPAPTRNPHGRRAITDGWVGERHREWVNSLPDAVVPTVVETDGKPTTKMLPFDKKRIFLYAYRHTYAQRHADAGVAVDVLRDLMDHRLLETSQRYYRVGDERRREAVERVTTMQFDRHGNRIWRQGKAILDSEHARRAIGEVAVPYGGCSEPSNVAAGGDDCPIRFRCIGCGHFSSDVSFLPDLQAYHDDLLRNRERLLATIDADAWAKAEAMPSDHEITRIRRLINRMKADLDDLSEEERAQIEEAVAVVHRARTRTVGLGMPRIRQPLPDIRPDRSA
jgi:integrase